MLPSLFTTKIRSILFLSHYILMTNTFGHFKISFFRNLMKFKINLTLIYLSTFNTIAKF